MKTILSTVLSSLELDKTTAKVIENISLTEDSKIKSIKNFDEKRFGQIISDNIKLLKSPMLYVFGVQPGPFKCPDMVEFNKQRMIEENKTRSAAHQHDIRTKSYVFYLRWREFETSNSFSLEGTGGKSLNLELKSYPITDFESNNGEINDIGDILFNHLESLGDHEVRAIEGGTKWKSLCTAMNAYASQISVRSKRGIANKLVITKPIYERFKDDLGGIDLPNFGFHHIEAFVPTTTKNGNSKAEIIVNMNSDSTSAYLVYKGSDTDAGAFFVPFAMNHRNCFDTSDETVTSYYAIHTRDDYKNYITKINFTKI